MLSTRRLAVLVLSLAVLVALACDKSDSIAGRPVSAADRISLSQPSPAINDAAATGLSAESPPTGVIGTAGQAFAASANRRLEQKQAAAQTSIPLPQEVTPGSMLVRSGQAALQVDSLEIGIARIRDVARRTNAVIANTSMAGGRDQTRSATMELRVPSERFDDAINGLSPIGKVESVNVSVQDVGEEFVDVQARMANARRLEQRLIELLANRTGKLSDVLTVERELARVREEIERYEGRLRFLRTRASISTLSVAIHEPYPIVADRPGAHPIRDAFVQAWRNVVGVTAAMIASLGVIVPLGVVVVALVLIGRRVLPIRSERLPKSAGPENA
jgi:hypothetical protein